MVNQNGPEARSNPEDESFNSYEQWYGKACEAPCGRSDYPYDQEKVERWKQAWQRYLINIRETKSGY